MAWIRHSVSLEWLRKKSVKERWGRVETKPIASLMHAGGKQGEEQDEARRLREKVYLPTSQENHRQAPMSSGI